MMTPCTICGLPCPGEGDDDEACCLACYTANLAGAELRPLAWVGRERRRWPGSLREVVAGDEGREA